MDKFEINKDGKKIELEFLDPTEEIILEANKKYNKTFSDCLESGGLLRKRLSQKLRDQGLWDDSKQQQLEKLQKSIVDKEYRLHKGKIKLSEARDLALAIKKERFEQTQLLSAYNEYDNNTVEGQADNAKFNYLVYACTVYSHSKERYFKTYDEFVSYKDPVAFVAASKFANLYYGLTEDFEDSLPENRFLKKYKFVNDDLRLVNSEGKLIDEDGNLVDEFGNKVDENGNKIDSFGYKRNEDGEFLEESEPFLDDDGNPIAVDSEEDSA